VLPVSYRCETERGTHLAAGLVRIELADPMSAIYARLARRWSPIVWAVGQIGSVRVQGPRPIEEYLPDLVCGWAKGAFLRWGDLRFEVNCNISAADVEELSPSPMDAQ
jgi:hypothetical protein